MALHLLTNKDDLAELQTAMDDVSNQVQTCTECGNIGLASPCHICVDDSRDKSTICVVEGVDDLWAIERGGIFTSQFHVLGGVVSAIDGVSPEDIGIPKLLERATNGDVKEVILALGASIDGQTTAHLIAGKLKAEGITVSTLARGLPVGAEVDYMDDGTLTLALKGRVSF
jgi:recombination protein RecR